MSFGPDDIKAIYQALESHAVRLHAFQKVNMQEPTSSPGTGVYCSFTLGPFTPFAAGSGLNSTTVKFTMIAGIWSQAAKRGVDPVDPQVLAAMVALMGALSGDFTLGGLVRSIDLVNMTGQPGWVEFDGSQCRAMQVQIPITINDVLAQAATDD